MVITRVRWAPYRVPFRAPYATSTGISMHRQGLLINVETDGEASGWGEAGLRPGPEPRIETLSAIARGAARRLIGAAASVTSAQHLFAVDELESDLYAAVACGLEVALLDVEAQGRGLRCAELLSADARDEVGVNALVTARETGDAVRLAMAAREAGFGAVKLKAGMGHSIRDERERVMAVRQALGSGVRLRLDPNGAWSPEDAIETINALEDCDIEYVEQPIAAGDLEALAGIQAGVRVPIAADEDVTDVATARRIIDAGAVQALVLKPQQLGGPTACLEIARMAHGAGMRCIVTTSIESGIGTAACLHLAAALPGKPVAHGLATASLLIDDLTWPALPVIEGRMRLPAGPGLGVAPDTRRAAAYIGPWMEVR